MVPCLQQGSVYIKRNLRVWRDQKCICLVGAGIALTCAGRQTTPSERGQHRAENGNLRKLGWTYCHGTMFAPRQCLYQKEATGVLSPEMYLPSRCKKPLLPVQADKLPRLKGDGIGPRTETCVNWGGSIAMVPCLHQGNFYIKRKLWVWRAQKCICLVGAKTTLTSAGRQITPSQGGEYSANNIKLRKLGWTDSHSTVFAPRQRLYQKEAMAVHRPEMFFPRLWRNPTNLCGPAKYPVSSCTI